MTELPESLRELIRSGPLTHLSTVGSDGSPQVSMIWIGLDGSDIVSGHMNRYQKVRDVERDPRVVLSFLASPKPGLFLAEHAIVRATATIEKGGAWQLLDDLTRVYLGADRTFPVPPDPGGFILRYRVERVGGVGPWAPGAH